ncbi:type II toxin-antitoxin system mRNA interferase toxin, RelE/StbE family [Rudanella paleaurantiibacter]|uniref:Type II toxin-antitoxin system mRNA interferase toxin, RelE/StbE family n=1 Tax=Rudanella paleaurantiibacter TaxID=2614655 RepID=A0A7J5TZY4_9BACT|nr:type II toxin-antitoxin system RelE/ParE family toxin [Rudanella paleaurantiibacter]KAB7730979.1 type II toxin-antitoxin system mRNA interferase toxin, RelE/StbE family [Rudanella paleaurantiibacter]
MQYTIAWTENARDEIRAILDYMLDHWEDGVTNRLADEIQKVADQLSAFPYLGIQHERYSSLRLIRVKPYYRLLYTVVEEKKEVLILNVLDTRQQ